MVKNELGCQYEEKRNCPVTKVIDTKDILFCFKIARCLLWGRGGRRTGQGMRAERFPGSLQGRVSIRSAEEVLRIQTSAGGQSGISCQVFVSFCALVFCSVCHAYLWVCAAEGNREWMGAESSNALERAGGRGMHANA